MKHGVHHNLPLDFTLPEVEPLGGKPVTLLIGTDRHVGEGTADREKRVAMTPDQVRALRAWLKQAGIRPTVYVVGGAGKDAGCSDIDYRHAGGVIVRESDLGSLAPAPDVVHALKEPSAYETTIPGPFMRIGALHVGAFHPSCGCAGLLKKRNFAAIFDGSSVGGHTCRVTGGFQAPLRCSMSVFAGKIAADYVSRHLNGRDGRVVIVGGGVVGHSVLHRLTESEGHQHPTIVLIEANPERCDLLEKLYRGRAGIQVRHSARVDGADLNGAAGLVLAAFRPGDEAPKVVGIPELRQMRTRAIIVDVAIDEGGSIQTPEGKSTAEAIAELGMNHLYVADTHLPRRYPREASEAHGCAVLPYLCVLLYVAARVGNAIQAVGNILAADCDMTKPTHFHLLLCDLRNGLVFSGPSPVGVSTRLSKGRQQVTDFLHHCGIPTMTF